MTRTIRRGVILSALVLSASACSSNNNDTSGNTVTPTPPPVVVTPPPRQEDNFGTVFGNAFRAVMDGEPLVVNDGDIVPVSLTTEPVNVN